MLELTARTASELAKMLRERKCSSVEAVEAHIQRIRRLNAEINAVVTLDAERARTEAKAADDTLSQDQQTGVLHGVPITVKDGFATAGLRTTFGLPWYGRRLNRYVPNPDAAAVAALRRAGAIVLGKTNVPLGCYDWQTKHPLFGRTNNPRDLGRTPGGSSGGSAAAVAAGLSPLDLASDVAGSIRVPAHFCGAFSLRPTEGRVPTDGMMPPGHPQSIRHAIVAGPVARSVADLRLAFFALADGEPADTESKDRSLQGLRVAFSSSVAGAPVARDISNALRGFAQSLEDAGCRVSETSPAVDFEMAQQTWGLVHGFEFAAGLPFGMGKPPLNKLFRLGLVRLAFGSSGYSRALARGYSSDAQTYFRALQKRDELVRSFESFLSNWDVWLCPVAGVTAFTHRRTGANLDVDSATVPYAAPLGVFNTVTALAGTPCVTLPIGHDRGGLPIGVQIHARRGDDKRLLDLAEQIEKLADTPAAPAI
jgi:amidase